MATVVFYPYCEYVTAVTSVISAANEHLGGVPDSLLVAQNLSVDPEFNNLGVVTSITFFSDTTCQKVEIFKQVLIDAFSRTELESSVEVLPFRSFLLECQPIAPPLMNILRAGWHYDNEGLKINVVDSEFALTQENTYSDMPSLELPPIPCVGSKRPRHNSFDSDERKSFSSSPPTPPCALSRSDSFSYYHPLPSSFLLSDFEE